jgi:transcriptional regulator with XRE-family HTH domain
MEDLPIFQERLLLARRRAGVSQGELAKRTEMYASDISKMERGHMLPTAPRLRRLAEALGVSADYLLGLQAEAQTTPSATKPGEDTHAGQPPAKRPRPRKAAPVG